VNTVYKIWGFHTGEDSCFNMVHFTDVLLYEINIDYSTIITFTDSFHWLHSLLGSWPQIFSFIISFTDGRTPWTSDQLVARSLLKHRTIQTQNKYIPNIHALCGIRTHDPGFRASENSSCFRPLGYRDRPLLLITYVIFSLNLSKRNLENGLLKTENLGN
jgi:hypothetical protein